MNVIRKDATITNVGDDEDFPGSFQVVLSTPSKDRDGDELATEDWKQPLPEHITFDIDHGMSVEKTVGSGAPSIDADGRLVVSGTYSSLQKAQDTRTLVKEGHIRTVSVAFMSEKQTKDGKTKTVRELLNGAFVAIPSNREAVVLASKALDTKAGARNSSTDQSRIQSIHDHAIALGATPADDTGAAEGATGGKALTIDEARAQYTERPLSVTLDGKTLATAVIKDKAFDGVMNEITHHLEYGSKAAAPTTVTAKYVGGECVSARAVVKAVAGSYEQREQGIYDALQAQYPGDDCWAYTVATFDDSVIYRVSGAAPQLQGTWQATYTYDAGVVTLGAPEKVDLVENVIPQKNFTEETTPPANEKSADADALALQYKAIEIAALAG